ncbi:hypothetical protein QBC34DRAFT_404017 [Podospora aff. communis PSN243]|uniref:F-box domain-containing protein n=1 Tax=Podospora aff. communis PSN243 TaxID=3040156 RepID=A0AAV9GNM9_9PEZI|nr:hypothetical protein QBC34DRAFT_404017 [Podospora aff. communis PSN243]
MASTTTFHTLPGEIRNQVYDLLFPGTLRPSYTANRLSSRQGRLAYSQFLRLRLVNRQLNQEVTTFLYNPPFPLHFERYFSSPTPFIFRSHTPIHHLRHAVIDFNFHMAIPDLRLRPSHLRRHHGDAIDRRPDVALCALKNLFSRGVNVERIDILFTRPIAIGTGILASPLPLQEYSWMDAAFEEPAELKWPDSYDARNSFLQPQVETWRALLDHFVSGNVAGAVETAQTMSATPQGSNGDIAMAYWDIFMQVERQKMFFGKRLIDLLREYASSLVSLKEIRVVGTVDRQWMEAVVGVLGVTVKAQLLSARQDRNAWVEVKPAAAERMNLGE